MKTYDIMVIGSGFAGMAATLFAAQRGLSVVQTGGTGGIDFSTGFIDLLAVHPVAEQRVWEDPFAALAALRHDLPNHPYAHVADSDILQALDDFTTFLAHNSVCYTGRTGRNTATLTTAGTVKPTYLLPCSSWNGVTALKDKATTLLVDFHGFKGISARQIAEVRADWPALRTARVAFPGMRGELYPEHMAWSMAEPKTRIALANTLREHIKDAQFVAFPAMLGMTDPMATLRHMEELLGCHVFEIPTLPPSIAGPRLRAAFDRGLPALGVRTYTQKLISAAEIADDQFHFTAGSGSTAVRISARGAVLASGRFFGKGLKADRHMVREAVFNLPVHQPTRRADWHRAEFFDPRGHEINQAGLETDAALRPVDACAAPFHPRLHAAGAILAHQDWMRMKCGAGLAIATAFKAVQELSQNL